MNFEALRYFVSVVEAGSISKATESLSISQQGLSKAITTLEHELNCRLMTRTQQGITLTENGKLFITHSQKLLAGYAKMQDDLRQFNRSSDILNTTNMQIVVSPICMFIVLNPMIERFYLRNTLVVEKPTEEAIALMDKTGLAYLVDLFEPLYPQEKFHENYDVIPLVEARYGVIAKKSMVPNLPKTTTTKFVSKLPMGLFLSGTTKNMYEYIFREHPLKNVVLATGSRSTLLEGVAAGRYALPIDSFHWKQLSFLNSEGADKVVFSEFEGDYSITFSFVYNRTNPPSSAQREYLECFARIFRSVLT